MKNISLRTLVGILLVVLGIVSLVQVYAFPGESFLLTGLVATMFIGAGLAFLFVLFRNPEQWWAAIPGIILIFLGMMIVLSRFVPGFEGRISGGFFLAGISLSFWVVFILARDNWWALIPAGTLATLAVIAGVNSIGGFDAGGILFIGLGLTFALLTFLPKTDQRQSWAWIPALVLFILGGFVAIPSGLGSLVWPLGLILAGGFLILRSYTRK